MPSDERPRQRRFRFPKGSPVAVRLESSRQGEAGWEWPLRDLGDRGLSFVLDGPAPGLEVGARIAAATVVVGHHRIHGELDVRHLTPQPDAGTVCGARFLPATERDGRALRAVIAWLESQAARQDVSGPRPESPP